MGFVDNAASCEINPNSLNRGIYQYFNTYFDTSPFNAPHLIISFMGQSLRFQIGACYSGELKYRMRGVTANEWTTWRDITVNQ